MEGRLLSLHSNALSPGSKCGALTDGCRKLLIFDALGGSFRQVKLRSRRADCPACGTQRTLPPPSEFDYEEFTNGSMEESNACALALLSKEHRITPSRMLCPVTAVTCRQSFFVILCGSHGRIQLVHALTNLTAVASLLFSYTISPVVYSSFARVVSVVATMLCLGCQTRARISNRFNTRSESV